MLDTSYQHLLKTRTASDATESEAVQTLKTASDTLVCALRERLSEAVRIEEPLLITSIRSGSRTASDNARLSAAVHQKRFENRF
jgi:hypothetical protein